MKGGFMNLFNTKEAKNAATIGIMCSIAYMITYLGRNILSAVSPELIEQGVFTTELVGTLSSVFFMSYAIGQLLNGMIGDLGAEKFLDIKCRKAGLNPSCVVLVATVRALKYNGGVAKADLNQENVEALAKGICNLDAHIENIGKYGLPVVVAINAFPTDTEAEMAFIRKHCEEKGVRVALSEVFAKGGEGGEALAKEVLAVLEEGKADFAPIYPDDMALEEKIRTIATKIYGADGVTILPAAAKELKKIAEMGYGNLPVCMAKTQYSLSDNEKVLGRPSGFDITVRSARLAAGAGFVVCETGAIMTMPGLPKVPAAEKIDIDNTGKIEGLF